MHAIMSGPINLIHGYMDRPMTSNYYTTILAITTGHGCGHGGVHGGDLNHIHEGFHGLVWDRERDGP